MSVSRFERFFREAASLDVDKDDLGGLSIALARTFKIIEPELPNPQSRHWERAFQVFDLLL